MIEPYFFAGFGMCCDCAPDLSSPQSIARFPLVFDTILSAVFFYYPSILGLKRVLPGEPKSVIIISYIEYFLSIEFFSYRRRNSIVDFMAIGDRSFTALSWFSDAAKY